MQRICFSLEIYALQMLFSMATIIKELSGTLSSCSFSVFNSLITGLVVLLAWLIILSLYRLYFGPIAQFPGPKLAALTQWYEIYYDIYLNGQFTLHVKDLHEKYGKF
jgi:low temperature requirement protein LtrA